MKQCLFFLLIFSTVSLSAQAAPDSLRKFLWKLDGSAIQNISVPDGAKVNEWNARIHYALAEYFAYSSNNSILADQETDLAIASALEALKDTNSSIEMRAVLADSYSKKIKDFGTALNYGGKYQDIAKDMESRGGKDDASYLYSRGRRYLISPAIGGGNPAKAKAIFQILVQKEPDNTMAHAFLAAALAKTGDKVTAAEEYNLALSICPGNSFAQAGLAQLK